jgi:hypothetical protein
MFSIILTVLYAQAYAAGTLNKRGQIIRWITFQKPGDSTAPVQAVMKAVQVDPVTQSKAGLDVSVLSTGIKEIKKSDVSPYCQQFIGKTIAGSQVQEAVGVQLKTGGIACSSTPLGLIPSAARILTTLISEPAYGATLDASVNNTIKVRTTNLKSGFFDDPNAQYYLVPSTLSPIRKTSEGHQHVVVQPMGNGQQPLDPRNFAFFKGINDKEVDPTRRELFATIPGGTIKNNGPHRICTISGTFGHQSALAPVQRRGPSDDCIIVNVVKAAGGDQKLVADDTAQNSKVTVNGQESKVAAADDNSQRDAGNQDMGIGIAIKNKEKADQSVPAQASNPFDPTKRPETNPNQPVNLPTGAAKVVNLPASDAAKLPTEQEAQKAVVEKKPMIDPKAEEEATKETGILPPAANPQTPSSTSKQPTPVVTQKSPQPTSSGQNPSRQQAQVNTKAPAQATPAGQQNPNRPAPVGQQNSTRQQTRAPAQPTTAGQQNPNRPAPVSQQNPTRQQTRAPAQPTTAGQQNPNRPAPVGQQNPSRQQTTAPARPTPAGQQNPNRPAPVGQQNPSRQATAGKQNSAQQSQVPGRQKPALVEVPQTPAPAQPISQKLDPETTEAIRAFIEQMRKLFGL